MVNRRKKIAQRWEKLFSFMRIIFLWRTDTRSPVRSILSRERFRLVLFSNILSSNSLRGEEFLVIIENWNSPITIVNPFQLFLERKYVAFQSCHLAGLIELLYRNLLKLRRINYLIFNVNRTRHKFSIKIHFSRYFERFFLSFFLSFSAE